VSKAKTQRKSTSDHVVTQYARRVVAGKDMAGPHVRNSCRRHLSDIERTDGIWFDEAAADRALGFFRDVLRLNSGEFEGQPFELLDWQKFIVGSLFGWKSADGFRRFRMAFVETGKGSGKSPLAAGIGLYCLTADGEWRAEVYAAASKQDQARVLFRDAVSMVQQSPALEKRLSLWGGVDKDNIAYLEKGAFFRPISSERQGKGHSGPRPHCGILDEVHEHSTNAMVEFLRAGTKGRRQALILMITNSGSDRESVCFDYHQYGCKIASGDKEDDSFFSYICALDENDDPFKDERCWPKANPSMGVTFGPKYLREQVHQAREMPSKQNLVLRLNFCVWTDADAAWLSKEQWEAVEQEVDIPSLYGRTSYGGLDLSGKRDLTALATVVPADDGTFDAWVEFWTPGDTLNEREDTDRVPYRVWVDQGHLHAPPGKTIDYRHVVRRLGEISADFEYAAIGYDRWRIDDLRRELDDEGIDLPLVEFGQGFKDMAPAVEKIEERILNGEIRVHTNPVLRWNVASAVLEEDPAGNRKFSKKKATGRIDGVVALAMAVQMAETAEPAVTSPWEDSEFSMTGAGA